MPDLQSVVRSRPSIARPSPTSLTLQAKAALYCLAGGESVAQVASRLRFNAAYLGRLAASPLGRAFIASVETDARRERARALFEASARKTVFAELVDDLMDAR